MGVCARSGDDELGRLEATKVYRLHLKGSTLAYPGEPLSHVGTIMVGMASLSRIMEDGRRQTIGWLHPGDFLGRPGRPVTPFLVEALTDVELCGFEHRWFDELLATSPQLHARLTEVMQDELDTAREWMVMLGRKSAREKICSFLVYLTYRQNHLRSERRPSSQDVITLVMTREQIADFLGTTLETVSRQFTALAKEGMIAPAGRNSIRIPDFRMLLEATGDDSDGGVIA
jgi:CRP/FNR family transcriptional regulator